MSYCTIFQNILIPINFVLFYWKFVQNTYLKFYVIYFFYCFAETDRISWKKINLHIQSRTNYSKHVHLHFQVITLISIFCLLLALVNGVPAPRPAKAPITSELESAEADLKTDESIGYGYAYPGYYGHHGGYYGGYYPYYGYNSYYSHYPYYGYGHGYWYWKLKKWINISQKKQFCVNISKWWIDSVNNVHLFFVSDILFLIWAFTLSNKKI